MAEVWISSVKLFSNRFNVTARGPEFYTNISVLPQDKVVTLDMPMTDNNAAQTLVQEVRISACSFIGCGDEIAVATGPPSPPQNISVVVSTLTMLDITIGPPQTNGGLPVTHYTANAFLSKYKQSYILCFDELDPSRVVYRNLKDSLQPTWTVTCGRMGSPRYTPRGSTAQTDFRISVSKVGVRWGK